MLTSSAFFTQVASVVRHVGDTRLLACGSGLLRESSREVLLVQRWHDDGRVDPTYAPATGGQVELGFETQAGFQRSDLRAPRCRAVLSSSAGDHVVVGDWSNSYDYGGGRILLSHLDASGAIDAAFDPSGRGRELALGTPDQWSNWLVADAATASDGAALLIARRTSSPFPGDSYYELGERPALIARVEVSTSQGVGAIGFNDAAVRIAERRPGDLRVYRSGGTAGPISVRYELLNDTTDAADVASTGGTLTWTDGDASPRTIPLAPVNDAAMEGEERFRVRLSEPTGGAGLGRPRSK